MLSALARVFFLFFAAATVAAPFAAFAQTTEIGCQGAALDTGFPNHSVLYEPKASCIPREQDARCAEAIGQGSEEWEGQPLCGDAEAICCVLAENTPCLDEVRRQPPQGTTAAGCVSSCENTGMGPTNLQAHTFTGRVLCPQGQVCCSAKNGIPGMVPLSGGAAPGGAEGVVSGGNATPGKPITLPDPLGGVTVPVFFGNVIRVFMSIAGAIALLMFVYGGMMWILSGGEASKVTSAQKILVNSTIGLILIFGAYLFTSAIVSALLGASALPPTP